MLLLFFERQSSVPLTQLYEFTQRIVFIGLFFIGLLHYFYNGSRDRNRINIDNASAMIDEDSIGTKAFSPNRSLCLLSKRCRDVSAASEILKAKPLAAGSYDGTIQSFAIACGNVTANRDLRDFGLFSLRNTLDGLERLFDQRDIGGKRSVVLFHKDTFLVHLENKASDVSDNVLFLDCHELQTCDHSPEEDSDHGAEMKEEPKANEEGGQGEEGVPSTPSSQGTTGLFRRKIAESPVVSKSPQADMQRSAEETQEPAVAVAAAHPPPVDSVNEVRFEHAVKRSKEDDVVEDGNGDGDDDVKDIQG